MPATGRKPNEGMAVRHRVPPTHEWREVEYVRFTDAPPLPGKWPAATKRWWAAVSTMPHCCLWTEEDWQFAFDTAVVHATFSRGNIKAATELRNREKVLGTTMDFRRDLRIRYVDPKVNEEPASVTKLQDYKARLAE